MTRVDRNFFAAIMVFMLAMSFECPAQDRAASDWVSMQWYDGERLRQVYRSRDHVVEFVRNSASSRGLTGQSALPAGARVVERHGGVRIWQLAPGSEPWVGAAADTVEKEVSGGGPWAMTALYRSGMSVGAPRMALTGTVLIIFPASWSEDQRRSWVAAQPLRNLTVHSLGDHVRVAVTGLGTDVALLEYVSRINRDRRGVRVLPNWWREVFLR